MVEYAGSLPSTMRTRNGVLKYLLKRVAADLLPAEILTRRKQGFGVPIKHWFSGDLNGYAYDVLLSTRARQRGIFNPEFIRNLLKAHASTKLVNHSSAIWPLLCLELWFQIYLDEPSRDVEQTMQTQITSNRSRTEKAICGICGVYKIRSREPVSRQLLQRMPHL